MKCVCAALVRLELCATLVFIVFAKCIWVLAPTLGGLSSFTSYHCQDTSYHCQDRSLLLLSKLSCHPVSYDSCSDSR